MICFAFFHWHQKSLGVQGGQPGSYLAFNGSLKLGPRDGCIDTHTDTHARTHKSTQTAGCLKPSQDLALISPLSLFHSFFSHSLPFSSQIAAAFDVLQRTIAEASALFYDSNSSLALVESALTIVSLPIPFQLSLVCPKRTPVPLAGYFYQAAVRNSYSCINVVIPLTFDLYIGSTFHL